MPDLCKTCGLGSLPPYSGRGRPHQVCKSCRRDQVTSHRRKLRSRMRQIIKDAKAVPCADCGVNYPAVVMDLDHVRGEKLFNIGLNNGCASEKRLHEELAKCDVRCANCHRLKHARERGEVLA